jgi:GxxExxY protein
VLNHLGTGFFERVYENALSFELKRNGLLVESQKVFHAKYEGAIVGEYQTDLVVPGQIIVE